ncbi:hypothetical protein ES695_08655 [Candidatus Atribacteria bacterium 1244-E10-H5-B2]|nr:MAG: hypothetical protein ES695_08655 [Candidatus Atribacteria bacterium 1244-E10-H5-B2]
MYIHKSLKLAILALLIGTLVIFSGCTAPPINHAPTIISAEITATFVETAYTYDVDAIDPDTGDILTYSLSVNPAGMDIDPTTGVINWTPTAVGNFEVTVEVSDGELTATQDFMITVSPSSAKIVYRALCVGVGEYQNYPDAWDNTDLPAPPYDVDRMRQTLGNCKFGLSNTEFSTIAYLKDGQATKSNILQEIASTFSDAGSNDISYFYFSGHGMRHENTSYLSPVEVSYFSPLEAYISVNELETALSAIPGTKVVFLDSCYSGGFIGKGREEGNKTLEEKLISFNEDVINIFSFGESKGLLTTNRYKVLTACRYSQESWEFEPETPGDFDPYGLFTSALCEGCGYDSFSSPYPADDNLDNKVSLHEAYMYIKSRVEELALLYVYSEITQEVQVYPSDSDFTIVEY